MNANLPNGSRDNASKPAVIPRPPRCIQFGVFELRTDTGELLKHGIKVKLQGKPCQILQALLERPGNVVTRDELRARLWPDDTSVDFESSLNTAANRLRLALGDSADNPRYVETLPRVGYRFIAPIQETTPTPVFSSIATPEMSLTPLDAPAETRHSRTVPLWSLAVIAGVAAVLVSGIIWFRKSPNVAPALHQVTFRRGTVITARFASDGERILYTARWNGEEPKLYTADLVSPESRELGFHDPMIAAVSSRGELALLAKPERGAPGSVLLRVRENGGAPLAVARQVTAADWSPDGETLGVVRIDDQGWVVEFPRGKVIYRSPGWVTDLRISPRGDNLAFIDHPIYGDDGGAVRILDRNGSSRVTSSAWSSAWGLAWAPDGGEVWFTAARSGLNRSLHAMDVSGKVRDIEASPGMMTLEDISRDGRVLVSHGATRMLMVASGANAGSDRDCSWFDMTRAQDISDDGRLILFDETGEGGGPGYSAYVHRLDSGGVVRLGEGRAVALAGNGAFALVEGQSDQSALRLIPLEPGPIRTISAPGLQYIWAMVFPGNRRLLVGGRLKDSKPRLYTQDIDGGNLRALEPPVWLTHAIISGDGTKVAGVDENKNLVTVSASGGEQKRVPLNFYAAPLRWSDNDRALIAGTMELPAKILRIDVDSGASSVLRQFAPPDEGGVTKLYDMVLSADAKTLVYSYERVLSELYVVKGWK